MYSEEEVNKLKAEIKKLESDVDQLQEKLNKQEERSATLGMYSVSHLHIVSSNIHILSNVCRLEAGNRLHVFFW
jgi:uncharacterized protein Yka (UPF0111/DUF47 family)